MISLKSKREIEIMREGGKILAEVLRYLGGYVKPGICTIDIDEKAAALIKERGAEAAFKGYRGYPANICASVNEEVVHGIPSERELEEGDILSVDIGVKYKNYFVDAARSWPIGTVSPLAEKMIKVAEASLYKAALPHLTAGKRLGDVSSAIQKYVESQGFNVVRDFVGHGIGQSIHEEPQVPNFGRPDRGMKLESGLVLAVEPMVTEGGYEVAILDNGWTVVTCDGKLASHHEDTVVVNEGMPEILTAWEKEI